MVSSQQGQKDQLDWQICVNLQIPAIVHCQGIHFQGTKEENNAQVHGDA